MSKYNNFHNRIKFLLELNKLSECLYFEEVTKDHQIQPSIKFEGSLTTLYANKSYWSPTEFLRNKIKELSIKYFKSDEVQYNNTGTTFWISDFGCIEPENMFYADSPPAPAYLATKRGLTYRQA